MASNHPNRVLAARAAAILTTGEVAGTRLDVNETFAGNIVVELSFTQGSLTNGIFRTYASMDGTTYVPLGDQAGNVSRTLTADTELAFSVNASGYKWFRATVQGTGTVTSSSATINYRYQRRGTQG